MQTLATNQVPVLITYNRSQNCSIHKQSLAGLLVSFCARKATLKPIWIKFWFPHNGLESNQSQCVKLQCTCVTTRQYKIC